MGAIETLYEKTFGIPKPKCCSSGDCCKGVSPSTPYHQLMKRAADGDEFAQNFFSIMEPYADHDAARAVVPSIVDKTLAAAKKQADFQNDEADVVFYRCRYLGADNRCQVHEDRPQFCRDYPDTPFLVFSDRCAYLPWAKAMKKQYHHLQSDLAALKTQVQTLSGGELTESSKNDPVTQDIAHNIDLDRLPLYLRSPAASFWMLSQRREKIIELTTSKPSQYGP